MIARIVALGAAGRLRQRPGDRALLEAFARVMKFNGAYLDLAYMDLVDDPIDWKAVAMSLGVSPSPMCAGYGPMSGLCTKNRCVSGEAANLGLCGGCLTRKKADLPIDEKRRRKLANREKTAHFLMRNEGEGAVRAARARWAKEDAKEGIVT